MLTVIQIQKEWQKVMFLCRWMNVVGRHIQTEGFILVYILTEMLKDITQQLLALQAVIHVRQLSGAGVQQKHIGLFFQDWASLLGVCLLPFPFNTPPAISQRLIIKSSSAMH